MSQKKGLGRGFDSLIPDNLFDESFDPTKDDDDSVSQLRILKLADIDADTDQPRSHFDDEALTELASSIKRHGVLQPIVVTKKGSRYEIVAGERRFRASKLAGNDTIPALVRSIKGQERLELALIENLQRRDLNALETAIAYAKLRDQFNLNLEQIGQAVGKRSASAISNTLRLLKLPIEVQSALGRGDLREGQARPLIGASEQIISELLPKIIQEKWSAREVEHAIQSSKQQSPKNAANVAASPVFNEASERMSKKYDTPIRVSTTAKGSGTIVIAFKNDAEFARLRDALL